MIGATEKPGSVGRAVLWNLISNPFGGTVYPINSNRPNVLGIKAYKTIAAVPDPVDLAVVVTPAPSVPGVIGECVEAGVKGAIIISAGFKETGPEGAKLEQAGACRSEARPNADHRSQLPGSDASLQRTERDVRRPDRPARARSASSARAVPCARRSSTGASGRMLASARLSRSDRCSMSAGET